jgi:hypothetical protein
VTRTRCWKNDWVVEFDVKAAFDQIDHALLMKAARRHIKESWLLLYIERWLTAPFETADGASLPCTRGTPQGGVVSPILMNLFMHYALIAGCSGHGRNRPLHVTPTTRWFIAAVWLREADNEIIFDSTSISHLSFCLARI